MKRVLWPALAVGLALLAQPALPQTEVLSGARFQCPSVGLCFKFPVAGVPLGFQQFVGIAAATGFTIPTGAVEAFIICETNSIRWRDDGVNPTNTVGMLLPINTPFAYTGKLSAFKMLETSASATCDVSYYQ